MKIMRLTVLFLAVAALIMAFGAGSVMANKTGGGGEPGAGCPSQSGNVKYVYNPPLFTGTLTASWKQAPGETGDTADVYIKGRVEQIDNPGCYGIVNQKILSDSPLADFLKHTPANVRQTCQPAAFIPLQGDCQKNGMYTTSAFWEIIGVTNMVNRLHTKYTATILLMGLNVE